MLMSLDQFVFSLSAIAYQELQRQTQWKHVKTSRVGARDAGQYLGPGDDKITLSGLLAPELTGKLASLDKLHEMANPGSAYAMVDGAGIVYGAFVIESVSATQTLHYEDGTPRRVEFSILLDRRDDDKATAGATTRRIGDINDGSQFEGYA